MKTKLINVFIIITLIAILNCMVLNIPYVLIDQSEQEISVISNKKKGELR